MLILNYYYLKQSTAKNFSWMNSVSMILSVEQNATIETSKTPIRNT